MNKAALYASTQFLKNATIIGQTKPNKDHCL